MGITVTGENLADVRTRIGGMGEVTHDISIRWRTSRVDYDRADECGCIVKDHRARIPLEFKDARTALVYIAKILKEHDAYAREETAKRKKKLVEHAKAKKK